MGVVRDEADQTDMLTVWIAMMEATPENSYLSVVPKSHKGALALHCHATDGSGRVTFPPHLRGTVEVTLPMLPGDVLFIHKKMMLAA